jgi:hypothetical protein
LDDITAVRHVVFVMKAGKIIKNEAGIRNAVPSATARK